MQFLVSFAIFGQLTLVNIIALLLGSSRTGLHIIVEEMRITSKTLNILNKSEKQEVLTPLNKDKTKLTLDQYIHGIT